MISIRPQAAGLRPQGRCVRVAERGSRSLRPRESRARSAAARRCSRRARARAGRSTISLAASASRARDRMSDHRAAIAGSSGQPESMAATSCPCQGLSHAIRLSATGRVRPAPCRRMKRHRGQQRAEHAAPILDHGAHSRRNRRGDHERRTTRRAIGGHVPHVERADRPIGEPDEQRQAQEPAEVARRRRRRTPPAPTRRARARRSRTPPTRKIQRPTAWTSVCAADRAAPSTRSSRRSTLAGQRTAPAPALPRRGRGDGVDRRASSRVPRNVSNPRRRRRPATDTSIVVTSRPTHIAGARSTRRQPSTYAPITPIARRSGGGDGVMGRVGAMLACGAARRRLAVLTSECRERVARTERGSWGPRE